MKKIAESVLPAVKKDQAAIRNSMCMKSGDIEIYPDSVHKLGDAAVMMGRDSEKRFLLVVADSAKAVPAGFAGDKIVLADGGIALVGALDAANAAAAQVAAPAAPAKPDAKAPAAPAKPETKAPAAPAKPETKAPAAPAAPAPAPAKPVTK